MVRVELQQFKVTALPAQLARNAIYFVKGPGGTVVAQYVTDLDGNAIPVGSPAGADVQPFEHVQADAAQQWIVNHNIGRRPASVTVLSVGGVEILADVVHVSLNQVRINFASPVIGRVIVL